MHRLPEHVLKTTTTLVKPADQGRGQHNYQEALSEHLPDGDLGQKTNYTETHEMFSFLLPLWKNSQNEFFWIGDMLK